MNRRKIRREFSQLISENLSDPTIETTDDMRLLKYEVDGKFDYELYLKAQTLGNKFKIDKQWVPEAHIEILADYMASNGLVPKTGICHGTRQGFEQAWFRTHIAGDPDVIGTEISDTATQFLNTIQWDFHEIKEEWIGSIDFIYSNSWDHAFDPVGAFKSWAQCLKPGGFLLLDHGWNYAADRVNALDPFGVSEGGLIDMLNKNCSQYGQVKEVIDGASHKRFPIRTIVFHAKDE